MALERAARAVDVCSFGAVSRARGLRADAAEPAGAGAWVLSYELLGGVLRDGRWRVDWEEAEEAGDVGGGKAGVGVSVGWAVLFLHGAGVEVSSPPGLFGHVGKGLGHV